MNVIGPLQGPIGPKSCMIFRDFSSFSAQTSQKSPDTPTHFSISDPQDRNFSHQSLRGWTGLSFGVGRTSITQILSKLQYFEVRCPEFENSRFIPKIPASFRKFAKIGLLRHYKKWVFAANRAYMDLQTASI